MTAERAERVLRWVILLVFLVNAAWIIWIPAFPTLDGWTHLHTARMLFEGAPEGIFCENPGLVPNRAGHLLLGALQLVLPSLVAERVLLALIMLGTGLGVWHLARGYGHASPLVLLVLPFTVSFMLVLGFHNFLLGVALAFLFTAAWITLRDLSWLSLAGLSIAGLLLFYTHTTALVLFLLLVAGHEATVLFGIKERTSRLPGGRWGAALAVLTSCMPAVLLFLDFNATQRAVWGAVDRAANLRDLLDLRCLVVYNYADEERFTHGMKLMLLAAAVMGLVQRWRSFGFRPVHGDIPLSLAALLMVLYFIMPDSSGYASYITVRLQWMAVLLFLVWVAQLRIPLIVAVPFALMLLVEHQSRNRYIERTMAPMAHRVDQVTDIADQLPEGSVVLPLVREDHWLLGHIPSLLATGKTTAVLDNYECGTGYFPFVWCRGMPADLARHVGSIGGCLEWLPEYVEQHRQPQLDRIVLMGQGWNSDPCRAGVLRTVLGRHYRKGPSNRYVTVYELID